MAVIIFRSGGLSALSVDLPAWIRPLTLGIAYGALPAYVVGLWIVSRFFPDPREEILELNLDEDGQISARSWFVPTDAWEQRNSGERPALSPDKGAEAIVTDLDPLPDTDTVSVEGANSELSNPVSVVARQGKLEQTMGDLLERAEEADKLEATVKTRALDIQSQNIHALLAAVEESTQMDPNAVSDAFSDDLLSVDPGADEKTNAEAENGQDENYDMTLGEMIANDD